MLSENTIYLGIGSNINKVENIQSCLDYFNSSFKFCQISPTYQSPSYGFAGHDFYNLVLKIKSSFDLISLKKWLMAVEDSHGRDRKQVRYSNRTLDIDILLYNEDVSDSDTIKIPRPEILTQAYVLKPLIDLAPDMVHPETGQALINHWQMMQQEDKFSLQLIKV
jgi:2-amino-4-hydroxy-6-hydroxymethyldihydropteridine diphosphokinase